MTIVIKENKEAKTKWSRHITSLGENTIINVMKNYKPVGKQRRDRLRLIWLKLKRTCQRTGPKK